MEGCRRGAALAAVVLAGCVLVVGMSGCGSDDSSAAPGTVRSATPERDFAPLLELASGEPWRPMSARWFIEHSVLWFAEDEGCEDRKVAVGRALPEQRNAVTDWIFPVGLGKGPAYDRSPYDANCDTDLDLTFYANQLTRPHDPGPRIDDLRIGEGFYLDLADAARPGPASGTSTAPAYVERTDEGDSGVRLTYWALFGMHGAPGRAGAHEGDWERIDVLLRDAGDDRYVPVAVQAGERAGAPQAADTAWAQTRRVDDTHPVVRLEPATHDATVTPPGESCDACIGWRTWRSLRDARDQLWYGFGGAWGGPGDSSATTGPLGPHRFWPSAAESAAASF